MKSTDSCKCAYQITEDREHKKSDFLHGSRVLSVVLLVSSFNLKLQMSVNILQQLLLPSFFYFYFLMVSLTWCLRHFLMVSEIYGEMESILVCI